MTPVPAATIRAVARHSFVTLVLTWIPGLAVFVGIVETARAADGGVAGAERLFADVAVGVAALAATWLASSWHLGERHAGLATAGDGVGARAGWIVTLFSSWALPVALAPALLAPFVLGFVDGASTPGAASGGARVAVRLAVEALLLCSIAAFATLPTRRGVAAAAGLLALPLLWRGHLLFPATSWTPVFGSAATAASVDEGLPHAPLADPSLAGFLLALALLAAWLRSGIAPPAKRRAPAAGGAARADAGRERTGEGRDLQ